MLNLVFHSPAAWANDVVRFGLGPNSVPVASAVEVRAGNDIVFLSGKVAPELGKPVPDAPLSAYGSLHVQTLGVLVRKDVELRSLGLQMSDIVKVQVFLVKDEGLYGVIDYAEFASAYTQFFGTPASRRHLPSRTTVLVAGLAKPGQLVEMEVAAVRSRTAAAHK